jgi:hypothetical protein
LHFKKVQELVDGLPQSHFLLQALHESLKKVWTWYKLSTDATAIFITEDLHHLTALDMEVTDILIRIKEWGHAQDGQFIGKPELSEHLKALRKEVVRITGVTNRKIQGRLELNPTI